MINKVFDLIDDAGGYAVDLAAAAAAFLRDGADRSVESFESLGDSIEEALAEMDREYNGNEKKD